MKITFNNKSSLNALVIGLAEEFNLEQHSSIDNELKFLLLKLCNYKNLKGRMDK